MYVSCIHMYIYICINPTSGERLARSLEMIDQRISVQCQSQKVLDLNRKTIQSRKTPNGSKAAPPDEAAAMFTRSDGSPLC